jgi:hypothetical protein
MASSDAPPPEIGLTGARFGGASRTRRTRAERAAAAAPPIAPESPSPEPAAPGPGDTVGLTGARFGGASRTRRAASAVPVPSAPVPSAPVPSAPVPSAPALSAPPPSAPAPPVAAPPSVAAPPPVASRPGPEPRYEPQPEPSPHTLVRPYVLTGGRTRATVEFAIEALITSVQRPGPVGEPMEHARIRTLCREPRSVAEVAALLGIPLGVARVLLADMLAAGAVQVHRTVDAGGPDLALMERVLAGLRRL